MELSERQVDEVVNLMNMFHNNTHLWCIHGCAPSELHQHMASQEQGKGSDYEKRSLVSMVE